jgi:8-oxo-dGTP pyrophosphatase MutT (NUDIX family)
MLSTTAAVLEILIIGIQGVVWVGFALSAILGVDIWLEGRELPDALLVAAIGLIAYALGVIIDRAADTLYVLVKSDLGPGLPPIPTMRLRMMELDDGRSRFLEYQRSRLRIARGTVLNLLAIIGTSLWFMVARTDLPTEQIVGVEVILGVLLLGAFAGAQRIGHAYDRRLGDAYSMWARDNPEKADHDRETKNQSRQQWRSGGKERLPPQQAARACERAAAVCYRMTERGPEFFLVKTSDGKRWTFPKGKLEDDEDPQEAAVREAGEEAGVIGSVKGELTTYRFPGNVSKGCPSVQVRAFLLHVEDVGDQAPGDRHRNRKWFTPDKARKKLAVRRDDEYSNEHARVIDEAVEMITGA